MRPGKAGRWVQQGAAWNDLDQVWRADEFDPAQRAALAQLRQLSLEAALVDDQHEGVPSAKLDLLAEMLPELVAEGHRALVFSQFTRFLRRVADRLDAAGVPYSYLDGRTRHRGRVVEEFRSGGNGCS